MQSDHPDATTNPRADPGGNRRGSRRLCLGGSFDPVHVGHLITARHVAETLGLPGVRLIPTAGNPHKSGGPAASAAERLEMLRLAVAGDPFFRVDPIELRRPPPSYTFDTVVEIAGDADLRVPWLIGTDLLPRLHTWHRFDELLERAELIVMRRAGHAIDRAGLDPRVAALAGRAIEVPQIELSATAIRQRVSEGLPIRHLVPAGVDRQIANGKLYQNRST